MKLNKLIEELKVECLKINLGKLTPVSEMKANALHDQIKNLEIRLEMENLKDLLDNLSDRLANEIDECIINKTHIVTDNSCRSDSTGYNLVEDVEFSNKFIELQEALEATTKLSVIVENLI